MLPKTLDLAWAAGFFEGEGTLGVYNQSNRPNYVQVRFAIGQKGTATSPPDVLSKFALIIPGGKIRLCPSSGKDFWLYTVANRPDVKAGLKAMLPWLGERRSAKAHECIQAIMIASAGRKNPPSNPG